MVGNNSEQNSSSFNSVNLKTELKANSSLNENEVLSFKNSDQEENFGILSNIVRKYFDKAIKPFKKSNVGNSLDEFTFKYRAKALSESLTNDLEIKKMIMSNPNVVNVLKKYDIKLCVNTDNIRYNTGIHMSETANTALGIFNEICHYFEFSIKDKEALITGATLHDFGKVLIPSEILNKKGKLDENERNVIQAHPELGYELLKCVISNEKILEIVRSHHSYIDGTGYPLNNAPSMLAQIVTAADIFTALTEKRVYKERMSNEKAVEFIEQKVKEGVLDLKIVECLKVYLSKSVKQETQQTVLLKTKLAVA